MGGPPTSTGPPSMSRAYSPPPPPSSQGQGAFLKVAGPPASQGGAFAKVRMRRFHWFWFWLEGVRFSSRDFLMCVF